MRWWDILGGWALWRLYLQAVWATMTQPPAKFPKVCRHPRRCPLEHRLALMKRPGQPMTLVLMHKGV